MGSRKVGGSILRSRIQDATDDWPLSEARGHYPMEGAVLPTEYTVRMKSLLGDEYDEYERSLEGPMHKALRLNPLKGGEAQLFGLCKDNFGDVFEQVPWEPRGFYYPVDDAIRPGSSPLHEAGAYYIQEPSAMKPVTLLDVRPGQRVLDLCAAPGGKSSQIAGYLRGEGLLVCNEPVSKRASVLSRNIERMGIGNAVVLNEMPQRLEDRFAGFFDRILVDAPCSGEGMFRKNEEEALREWSPDNVRMCAKRQAEILESAALMLRPGGMLVYSTCTFSHEEDEDCIDAFLKSHSDYELISQEKLYPHRVRGEGHFMAVLRRAGEGAGRDAGAGSREVSVRAAGNLSRANGGTGKSRAKGNDPKIEAFDKFCSAVFGRKLTGDEGYRGRLTFFGDNMYLLPEGAPDLKGLKVERPGLQLGTVKTDGRGKARFEPAHALALFLKPEEVESGRVVDITLNEAEAYIKGLTLNVSSQAGDRGSGAKGWVLICVCGLSIGWGKLVNGTVKNHYPKGLRVMRQ